MKLFCNIYEKNYVQYAIIHAILAGWRENDTGLRPVGVG